MKYLVFGFVILALAYISACDSSDLECIRASSNIVTVTRDHKDFRGIVFNEVGDVFLTQGPEYSVQLTGPDNVVELTESIVDGEILIIGIDKCYNGDYDFKIEITAPEIQYVGMLGVGRIETVGSLETDVIQFEVRGIAEVEAEIYADTLYTTISGNVTFDYAGEVFYHEISSTGDYEIRSFPLETEYTSITLSGQGDNYVTAYDILSVKIIGIGDVYYQGNPIIIPDISGTGEIIDSNP